MNEDSIKREIKEGSIEEIIELDVQRTFFEDNCDKSRQVINIY